MTRKVIRHLDFPTLVLINREVVSLTGEKHEYDQEDESRIKSLAEEIVREYNQEEFRESIVRKTSLLVFRIATGQHFHEGNKRTALVAASAFLRMNGCSVNIKDEGFVSVVDRAGIAAANLNEIESVLRRLVRSE
ncbi:MAG: type II toxin-antitoxin system death-on-curing family toxin [Thaumarchaeota archaeon]|nr:type II toxin-antitoxin system death-on-curing family toxin [Nitrososphaerota archaeon]